MRSRLRALANRSFPGSRALLGMRVRLDQRRLARDAAGYEEPSTGPPGDQPFPPRRLRTLTVPSADPDYFVWSGGANFELIKSMLADAGTDPGSLGAVLDFGCGCGRVARWWSTLPGPELHGCDYNPELASWCEQNLAGVSARTTQLEPPLPYPDGRFDLIYSLSIFTHLPERMQMRWIAEQVRVLRPGGHLLLTLVGESRRERLAPEQRAAFDRGELVTQFDQMAGTNMCVAFHPRAYVHRSLLAGLEVVAEVPGSGTDSQDAYLARSPAKRVH